ncbi:MULTISPECIES: DUF6412 domain-containing protein [Micromonospora]|uniref:Uncharacterized protein n=1 Tax=Micromonospora yangpuensis TaxID=683228 RepID=A0A1C6V7I2_9ACTN|nr:DUF6412 domain-containing protein [Micromonospora yangpuensis]GGM19859.1 hypothetical protein GCM10012279_42800 [Micromonospora yangpuensis]SCL62301.1 hypothetical protein GA0070617_4888 [Micromonospora yangpuensis]
MLARLWVLTWVYLLTQSTVLADRPAELLAGAAVVAAALLAALLAAHPRACTVRRIARHGTGLRQRARQRRMPRQVDPDAAGRPRPRAPGAAPSAA